MGILCSLIAARPNGRSQWQSQKRQFVLLNSRKQAKNLKPQESKEIFQFIIPA